MNPDDTDVSTERRKWLYQAFDTNKKEQSERLLSSHALLLEIDIGYAFCAGAWMSTIVLACSAIEAKVRQIDTENYESKLGTLLKWNSELRWLTDVRNEIMHAAQPGTKSNIWKANPNDLGACHEALEADARRAITVMFKTLYG
ncbi:MAG: hypothetical protein IPP85_11190 [Propionivibrio sp.]|nr:hypothetical protein [Propionivibrio sp.]